MGVYIDCTTSLEIACLYLQGIGVASLRGWSSRKVLQYTFLRAYIETLNIFIFTRVQGFRFRVL